MGIIFEHQLLLAELQVDLHHMRYNKKLVDMVLIQHVLHLLLEFFHYIRPEHYIKIGFLEWWYNLSDFIRVRQFV